MRIPAGNPAALNFDLAAVCWLQENRPDPLVEMLALLKAFMGVTDD